VNEFLPAQFVERVERLVIGIEPIDAQRAERIAFPIDLAIDGVPYPPMETSWEGVMGMADPIGRLREIPRHNSCRHAIVFPPAMAVVGGRRRGAPRRARPLAPVAVAMGETGDTS